MPLIKWRDSYSVAVENIDEEHKMLVEIVNDLFLIVKDHGHVKDSAICINKLIQYTQQHFIEEEAMMEDIDFPLLQ